MLRLSIFIISVLLFVGFCPAEKSITITKEVADYSVIDSVLIGDLLSIYAQKPKDLIYIKSEAGKHQSLAKAIYEVEGIEAGKRVEEFLIRHYKMGRLKFYCCGWESGGQLGQYTSKQLKAIDPYCSLIITMHSDEILDRDRNKVKKLYVVVEVVVV